MRAAEYERMFRLEERYWWFVARRALALALLRRGAPAARRVLDLGCGTGMTLAELGAEGPEGVGLDAAREALGRCRRRGLARLALGTGEALPFRDACFDAVLALDVFEHIRDDAAAMEEVLRVLRPGGCLVVSVPAATVPWSAHDDALHHVRRYARRELRSRLRAAGFEVRKLSFAVGFLYPVMLLARLAERARPRRAGAGLPAMPGPLNRALVGLHRAENALILRVGLPLGASLAGLAVKAAPARPAPRAPGG